MNMMRKDTAVISVLILAIGGLLVYLAVDYELKRPRPSTGQERTMPDGTVLVLQKVTFGNEHQFEFDRPGTGLRLVVPLLRGGRAWLRSHGRVPHTAHLDCSFQRVPVRVATVPARIAKRDGARQEPSAYFV